MVSETMFPSPPQGDNLPQRVSVGDVAFSSLPFRSDLFLFYSGTVLELGFPALLK